MTITTQISRVLPKMCADNLFLSLVVVLPLGRQKMHKFNNPLAFKKKIAINALSFYCPNITSMDFKSFLIIIYRYKKSAWEMQST